MTPEPAPTNHGPKLPIVGLVLSVVGLCFPPLLLASFGIGAYSYLRAKKEADWKPRLQLTQMTMAVSGAGLAIFLGMGVPQWKRFTLRSKQMACRTGLASLYAQQLELKKSNNRFTTHIAELPSPPASDLQLFRLAGTGPLTGADAVGVPSRSPGIDEALPSLVRAEIGLKGECPACQLTMLCAAQIDADATVDVWTISTIERTGNTGERIPAGTPWLEVDDLTQ